MNQIQINPLILTVAAFRQTWRGLDSILRLAWFPVLIIAIVAHLVAPVPADGDAAGMPPGGIVRLAILGVAGIMVQAMIAVAWHRTLLTGFDPASRRIYIRFGLAEFLYGIISVFLTILVVIGLYVVTGIVATILTMVLGVSGAIWQALAFLVGMVPAIVIVARSALVLPAIAVGKGADLIMSWQATRGNGARISATLILVSLPLIVASIVLLQLSGSFIQRGLGEVVEVVVSYVNMIINILMMCLVVSALSLLYAQLANRDDEADT